MVLAGLVTAGVVYSRSLRHHAAAAIPADGPTVPVTMTPDVTTMNGSLDRQDDALLAGDQAAWLAAVDPSATKTVAEYQRIFHNLSAMKVASWHQESYTGFVSHEDLEEYSIRVDYCLVAAPCNGLHETLAVTAKPLGGRMVIETITLPAPDRSHEQPLPWLVSDLSVAVGSRVIVAATTDEQGKLPSALRKAEQAAAVADRYAHWVKPDQYVVYLAGAAEAKTWFGGKAGSNTIVSTRPVSNFDIETVLYMPAADDDGGPGGLIQTMRWSMGEIALQYGAGGNGNNSFVNGLARYISTVGQPSWNEGEISSVRTYVRSGKWKKNVYLTTELASTDNATFAAAEGIGVLAFTRMIQRFGLSKTLDFWGDVERSGYALDNASRTAFGLPWASVNTDCVNYIEQQF